MTDTPIDRDEIRRKARAQAVRMGLAKPDPEAPAGPAVKLPTLRFGALKALLDRGHLSPAQATEARALFAAARENGNTIPDDTPKDAA
jgi:hypothetical protein